MEKKTFVITLIGLLGGLLVGVALGYFVLLSKPTEPHDLQDQIDDLQNQIAQRDSQIQVLQQEVSELETLLGPIRKGAWNLIKSFEGASALINTNYFYVAGNDLRINWTWVRTDPEFGSFSIYLYQEGQIAYTEAFLYLQENGTTYTHNTVASYYYLKILGSNLDHWNITIEAWIPK